MLVHEMVHAVLMLRGEDPGHNGEPWCKMISDLSPAVLGGEISARPARPRRVPNPEHETNPAAPKTIVARRPKAGTMTRPELASWPHSKRPRGYYPRGQAIPVPTSSPLRAPRGARECTTRAGAGHQSIISLFHFIT